MLYIFWLVGWLVIELFLLFLWVVDYFGIFRGKKVNVVNFKCYLNIFSN